MKNSSLTIYDNAVQEIINLNFKIEKLDAGCHFSEGPVWNEAGFYLFSDIPQNVICKIIPGKSKEVFIAQSGFTGDANDHLSEQVGSNGLAYDGRGNLLICQHGNGAVAQWNGSRVEPFVASYNDKRFNSPNDIIVHRNGSVFFSDPPYGLKDQKLQLERCQPRAGIYCWKEGNVLLISQHYQYPNGVCLSPDGNSLFTCSNKPYENFVLEFDAATHQYKRKVSDENGDGIKCDSTGNIYLCTKEGILIINREGKRLAKIELETIPANACWGGTNLHDLFITARQHIFLIRNLQRAQ